MGKGLLLEKIYYGQTSGALRGPQALLERAHKEGGSDISLDDVKAWLKAQAVYTRFRPARRKYPRNRIKAYFPGDVVQIDIMDMQNVVGENDGFKYAFLSYDTYSKYTSGWPMVDRTPSSVLSALENCVSTSPFEISTIYWDKEGSFLSKVVQKWLTDRDIRNYTTTSSVKAPGVERVIRTIRLACARYFKLTNTSRWVDFLPKWISQYNNRPHSTTKLRPLDLAVDPMSIPAKLKDVDYRAKVPPVGAWVRLNQIRGIFGKEAKGNWTDEIFKVIRHKSGMAIPMAIVQDLRGDEISGSFYPWELQEIEWDGAKRPSLVHKTRVRHGEKEYLVSYHGYPADLLEWTSQDPQLV